MKGNYVTPYDLARVRSQDKCAEYLISHYGGQRGKLLANIYARRIQKLYRKYKSEKKVKPVQQEKKIPLKPRADSLNPVASRHILLKQAKLCLDNKKFDDRSKARSLSIAPHVSEENDVQERRRNFAKSRTTFDSMNQSDESK